MKKFLLIVLAILLLAATCNKQPAIQQNTQTLPQNQTQNNNQQNNTNQTSITSGQKYVITAAVQIGTKGGDNKELHFSVLNSDGALVKTIPTPKDLITGAAGNVKVLGGEIYYMSGTFKSTSVGMIDVQTGQSKILNFTKNNYSDSGLYANGLYAILDWDVSSNGSKIAWINTDGKIRVANTDGSNIQTYNSGISKPTGNKIKFIDNYLYFSTFSTPNSTKTDNNLERIDLSNGSIDTVIDNMWPDIFAVSDSGKYIAYYSYNGNANQFVIKNTESNLEYIVPEFAGATHIAFSPNESNLTFTQHDGPGTKTQLVTLDLTNSKKLYSIDNSSIVGYISDTRVVVSTDKGIEITNLNGTNPTKLNNEYPEGVLTAN